MSRFLILLISVLAFFWLLRRALGSRKSDDGASQKSGRSRGAAAEDDGAAPDLVPCAVCGVLLPKDEALIERNAGPDDADAATPRKLRFYCGEAHRRKESA